MKTVTIIIPCYNEAQSIPLLYAELCKMSEKESDYDWEYLFINDGSKDNTLHELEKLHTQDERMQALRNRGAIML